MCGLSLTFRFRIVDYSHFPPFRHGPLQIHFQPAHRLVYEEKLREGRGKGEGRGGPIHPSIPDLTRPICRRRLTFAFVLQSCSIPFVGLPIKMGLTGDWLRSRPNAFFYGVTCMYAMRCDVWMSCISRSLWRTKPGTFLTVMREGRLTTLFSYSPRSQGVYFLETLVWILCGENWFSVHLPGWKVTRVAGGIIFISRDGRIYRELGFSDSYTRCDNMIDEDIWRYMW